MKNDILMPGEKVIREGTASRNNIDGYATLGGSLILTNLRIIFVTFKNTDVNCVIPLSCIITQNEDFNIHCDTPNLVEINASDGRYQFTVKQGDKTPWEKDIADALCKYNEKFPKKSNEITLEEVPSEEVVREEIPPIYEQEQPLKEHNIGETKITNIPLLLVVLCPIIALFFENGFWFFIFIAMGICYWDESNLYHAGYNTATLTKAFIIPVYIFKRARLTKSGMTYLVLWCITFLVSIIGTFTTLSAIIDFLQAINNVNNVGDNIN